MAHKKRAYLYKYKSLDINHPEYISEILNGNKIFMPCRTQLNDPLEGLAQPIYFHEMGVTRYKNYGALQPTAVQYLDQFRILSLSEAWNIYPLWAHYADNFQGICIEFNNDESFDGVKRVTYSDQRYSEITYPDPTYIDEDTESMILKRNLFQKSTAWSYEKEWRICKKNETYLYLKENTIHSVMIGNVLEKSDLLNMIIEICTNRHIPVYYVMSNQNIYKLERYILNPYSYKSGEYDIDTENGVLLIDGKMIRTRSHNYPGGTVGVEILGGQEEKEEATRLLSQHGYSIDYKSNTDTNAVKKENNKS